MSIWNRAHEAADFIAKNGPPVPRDTFAPRPPIPESRRAKIRAAAVGEIADAKRTLSDELARLGPRLIEARAAEAKARAALDDATAERQRLEQLISSAQSTASRREEDAKLDLVETADERIEQAHKRLRRWVGLARNCPGPSLLYDEKSNPDGSTTRRPSTFWPDMNRCIASIEDAARQVDDLRFQIIDPADVLPRIGEIEDAISWCNAARRTVAEAERR